MPDYRTPPGPPPTVVSLKAMGITGVSVTCTKCHNCKTLVWADGRARDDGLFPDLAARSFRCSGCGARDSVVMPDWEGYRRQGEGR